MMARKILFVHGWNGRSSQFYKIIELLSDNGYDITAVDLPVMEGQVEATQTYPKLQTWYLRLRNLEGLMMGLSVTRSGV